MVESVTHDRLHAGVRAVRSAPGFNIAAVAAAAGVGYRSLQKHLRNAEGRGPCSQTAAAAAATKPEKAGLRTRVAGLSLTHPACPPTAVRAAGTERSPVVRDAPAGTAAWAGRLSSDTAITRRFAVCALSADYPHSGPHRMVLAAMSQGCPPALLGHLPTNHAASNPNCLPQTLWYFSGTDEAAASNTARNPVCPPALLEVLSHHQQETVRSSTAENPNCPPGLLSGLADDPDSVVALAALRNPRTPSEVLAAHGAVADTQHRDAVASNPHCPPAMLAQAAKDRDMDVRHAAATNVSCPPALLSELAAESHWVVRDTAAQNPSTPIETLRVLASDQEPLTRESVAMNPSCPEEILDLLAEDSEDRVRWGAATNPTATAKVIRMLIADRESMVSEAAAEHRSCSASIRQRHAAHDPTRTGELAYWTLITELRTRRHRHRPAQRAAQP